jgi:hypothetical protein
MTENIETTQSIDLESSVNDILSLIEQEREREIITRRFGLYDRRETLEQIGELLGITRERVRQLEKVIITKGGGGVTGVAQELYDLLLAENQAYKAKYSSLDSLAPEISNIEISNITVLRDLYLEKNL